MCPLRFSDARLQIFIQFSATLTKLCHIKHDHPVGVGSFQNMTSVRFWKKRGFRFVFLENHGYRFLVFYRLMFSVNTM